jgi:hypothetical protein
MFLFLWTHSVKRKFSELVAIQINAERSISMATKRSILRETADYCIPPKAWFAMTYWKAETFCMLMKH